MKSSKPYATLLFIFISMILMNFTCNDCEDEIHDEVLYRVLLSDDRGVYQVGDTLVLSTSNPAITTLERSGATFDNSGQHFQFEIKVFEGLPNEIRSVSGREKFEYVEINSTVLNTSSIGYEVRVSNVCSDSLCDMSLGIVMNEVGYFGIALDSGWFGGDLCEFISYFPDGYEVSDNNFQVFSEINIVDNIFVDGTRYSEENFDRFLFFFKVEE